MKLKRVLERVKWFVWVEAMWQQLRGCIIIILLQETLCLGSIYWVSLTYEKGFFFSAASCGVMRLQHNKNSNLRVLNTNSTKYYACRRQWWLIISGMHSEKPGISLERKHKEKRVPLSSEDFQCSSLFWEMLGLSIKPETKHCCSDIGMLASTQLKSSTTWLEFHTYFVKFLKFLSEKCFWWISYSWKATKQQAL